MSKIDFQNHPFGWLRFENRVLKKLFNNDDKNVTKFYSKLINFLGTSLENKN